MPWTGCGTVPFAACFSCDKISACSSDKKESLNLPKDLAAAMKNIERMKGKEDGFQHTRGEAVYGIRLGDIYDPFCQKVVWVDEIQRTRKLDSYLVHKLVFFI